MKRKETTNKPSTRSASKLAKTTTTTTTTTTATTTDNTTIVTESTNVSVAVSVSECNRMVDGKSCARRECTSPLITTNSEAVMIATNEKLFKKLTDKDKTDFYCKWAPGRIVFHKKCWEEIVTQMKGSKSRSKKGEKSMTTKEACLVDSGLEVAEFFDGWDTVGSKAKDVARMIQEAKHVTAFTGAGISTSAGISDYRGTSGVDTKQHLGQHDEEDEGDVQYLYSMTCFTSNFAISDYLFSSLHNV